MSFRNTSTLPQFAAESGWAREYSPGPTTQPGLRAQNNLPVQHSVSRMPLSMQQGNRGLHGMSIGSPMHRPDMMAQGMGGAMDTMDTMGARLGPEMHNYGPVMQQPHHDVQQSQSSSTTATNWDTAFTAYDRPASPIQSHTITEAQPLNQAMRETNSNEADQLARTAGRLVSTVEHETNSKFKQSNFLNLMRKIRDKQAGIEGKDIVERSTDEQVSSPSVSLDKGKGRENWSDRFRQSTGRSPTSQYEAVEWARQQGILHSSSSSHGPLQLAPGPTSFASEVEGRESLNEMWAEEDARSEAIERQAMQRAFIGDGGNVEQRRREDAAEFEKYQQILGTDRGSAADAVNKSSMEEEFDELQNQDFVGRGWQGHMGRGVNGAQSGEWDTLQKNWDAWQADSAGLVPSMEAPSSAASAPQYRFHAVNPYVGATNSSYADTIATSSFPADMQSVLEREATVQRDPTNAGAWLDLGVKQQENEREGLAIAALHRAIQLDPTLRDAWLALAVSYTNENDRVAAFEAIERWIEATPQYSAVVKQHRSESNQSSSKASQSFSERHERLSNLLIVLARHGSMQNVIDADVQVALGVLFNASEDYDKAVDCFTAALSVRPDDWLLYNRLGATLSNSGRSEEALRYYHQALDLRPGFVRCHFNLSISCLNLKLYQDAASHIYTALTLQSEGSEDDVQQESLDSSTSGGVTSNSLWETLRIACELMNRPELASLTKERDLNRFDPIDFGFGMDQDQIMGPTM